MAIAHSMLIAIYHMIRDGAAYRELGAGGIERRSVQSKTKALIKQLERLGYAVELRSARRLQRF